MADATDNFDSYADGSSLASAPDWTVDTGSFTISKPASNGAARGSANSVISSARYTGETFDADQYAECVFIVNGSGGANAHGVMVRRQAGVDSSYYLFTEATGNSWYLGILIAGAESYPLSSTFSNATGAKLRLEVAGAGSAARLNGYYDIGAGWVQIVTNYDPGAGKYLDGGSPGIVGYSNGNQIDIDSWLGGPIVSTSQDADADFTLDDFTSFLSSAVMHVVADADFTLDDIPSFTSTAFSGEYTADADFTLDDISFLSTTGSSISANANFTLDDIPSFISTAFSGERTADVSFTLDDIAFASVAKVQTATSSLTLDDLSLIATASGKEYNADASFTLDDITFSAKAFAGEYTADAYWVMDDIRQRLFVLVAWDSSNPFWIFNSSWEDDMALLDLLATYWLENINDSWIHEPDWNEYDYLYEDVHT